MRRVGFIIIVGSRSYNKQIQVTLYSLKWTGPHWIIQLATTVVEKEITGRTQQWEEAKTIAKSVRLSTGGSDEEAGGIERGCMRLSTRMVIVACTGGTRRT